MRLKTPTVQIGTVKMGAKHPIVIQSMTNTDTADWQATAKQAIELADAGSEIVRMTVNTDAAAKAVPKIRSALDKKGYAHLPLIGDFHYNGHTLLESNQDCAKTLDKYRINPGNVGFGDKHEYNFSKIIDIALKNDKAVRIGVNWGSLDQDLLTKMMNENAVMKKPKTSRDVLISAMVESALRSAKLSEKLGMANNKIVLSVKMSILQDMVDAYKLLAKKMQASKKLYALHLGLTEAGSGLQGVVSSTAALSILLQEGIGDTIRVSLTPDKQSPRIREVEVCKELLQALGMRYFKPQVTSCPGCGRTGSHFFQDLAQEINQNIDKNMPEWKKLYPGVERLKIAVMGCVVNGPGESKYADIAISLPGKMEKPVAPVYIDGEFVKSLQGAKISQKFMGILEKYISNKYDTRRNV